MTGETGYYYYTTEPVFVNILGHVVQFQPVRLRCFWWYYNDNYTHRWHENICTRQSKYGGLAAATGSDIRSRRILWTSACCSKHICSPGTSLSDGRITCLLSVRHWKHRPDRPPSVDADKRLLCRRPQLVTTSIRRPFDCLSKVIKVTVTLPASRSHADLFIMPRL